MKRRVIFCMVTLLALLAVFGIPTVHGAEAEPEIRIDNGGKSITVTEANAEDVLGDGTVRYTAPRDAEPAVLSLRGAEFDRLSVVGGPLILEITGENTVSGVVTADDVTADDVIADDVTVDDAIVDENPSVSGGMTVNGKLTVRGAGTLTVKGGIVILEEGSITTEMRVLANNVEKPEGAFEIEKPNAGEYLSPYIRFEPISHDVLYHDDTCDDNPVSRKHYNGMSLILPEALFDREGYTQIGWRDGRSGKTYELGAEIKEDAGTDYYPVWEVNRYKVTFDFGGGGENVVLTLAYGTAIEVPEIPVWVGHRFCGWKTQIPDTVPAKDLTLQAIWALCDHSGNTAARSCVTETVCSVCGAGLGKGSHCAGEDDGDCTTPVTCRACGVVLREACDAHCFSEWESLTDGKRYRKCVNAGCTYAETERVLPPPTTTKAKTGTDSTPDSEPVPAPVPEPVSEPDTARTSEPETTPIGKTEPETSTDLPEGGTTTRPTADTAVYGPAKPDSDASRPNEKHGCASTLPNLPVLLVLAAFSLFRRRE